MRYANTNSVIFWHGPSRIDGAPIMAVATGITKVSVNVKTGAMVQVYIIRSDVSPMDALLFRLDVSVCGGCVHRPKSVQGGKIKGRSCYVNLGKGAGGIWKSIQAGRVETVNAAEASRRIAGRPVRLGAYGDPAAVPAEVWAQLLEGVQNWTGYTHQAASPRLRDVLQWCQVSADILGDAEAARAAGVGSFRVLAPGEEPAPFETLCPSEHGVLCVDCGACSGMEGKQIAIPAHGIGKGNFRPEQIRRRALSLPVLNPARARTS